MDDRLDDLKRRLVRLERAVLLLIIGIAGASAAVLLDRTGDPETLRARALDIVDADGAVRATLGLDEGNPVFALRDRGGVDRLRLFHAPDATGVYVMDSAATTRIGIAQFAHGGGGVALHGPESRGAAVLYLKGEGSLRFFDAEGTVTARLPAGPAP